MCTRWKSGGEILAIGLLLGAAGGATAAEPSSATAALHKPLACTQSPTAAELMQYKAPQAKQPYTVTLMEVSLNGYYYQLLAYGAEQAAKDAGVKLHLTAASGYTTPAIQLGQADNELQRGTQGVVFAPVDINGSIPTVAKFKEKGIPVVNVSTEVADPYVYTVMQDDYTMGKELADQIAKLAPGGGPGIMMAGPANATWSAKRVAGFQDQVKAKYPNLQIVAAPTSLVDPSEALNKLQNALQAHPNIKWLASVDYSLPVPQSVPAQAKGLPYATMGFDPNTKAAIIDGLLASTLPTDAYYMGYVGVSEVVSLLNGEKPTKFNCLPFPAITKQNVDDPFAQRQLYPEGYHAQTD